MSKTTAQTVIRLRGVRHNNLKGFDLDLPTRRLIVITGLSGSGKSSLAFDTLFAEGQRRYIETFSPYARQFFDRMDKPRVDSIEGIPPAIAIEQRNSVKTTRSTVGTMTEICDYLKLLWPHVSKLYCQKCGREVRRDSPQDIWLTLNSGKDANDQNGGDELLITFDLPLTEKLPLEESLGLIEKQGYQRLLLGGEIVRLEESAAELKKSRPGAITVVQDRLRISAANRARFVEGCEQAYHYGKGKLAIHRLTGNRTGGERRLFSNRRHCAECDLEYRDPSPALFSFNHPVGACPACRGFGRTITIDYRLAIPDRSKTLSEGVVKPWLTGHGLESQRDLMKFCKLRKVPVNVPFDRLPRKTQEWVVDGDPGYGTSPELEWPKAWYGLKGYFRWLESKSYKMHYRVFLARYRSYQTCPTCNGARFQPEALQYRLPIQPEWIKESVRPAAPPSANTPSSITLADFYLLPVGAAYELIRHLAAARRPAPNDPLALVLNEVEARLGYLAEVGLSYLTLDRSTRTLSGGETERVSLTTCLGSRLVNTLFVLDEPSVGLHSRDTDRLVKILHRLRDAGNTVVVVEHEASVMRAADQIIDLGPGHGESGGHLVFQGTYTDIKSAPDSLTGRYLGGHKEIPAPKRRAVLPDHGTTNGMLSVENATRHNLVDLTVQIPLQRFVCITGVSGSGKTTLAREVLLPALEARLKSRERPDAGGQSDANEDGSEQEPESEGLVPTVTLNGSERINQVVIVDQSSLGRTPRSNPAVYIGAFDDIRDFFAASEPARQRGLNSSSFSFNSGQGQCERCRGAGFEKIEMQFLSDIFIRCPDCDGRRYRAHILEIKIAAPLLTAEPGAMAQKRKPDTTKQKQWSIGDMLDASVDEAIAFLTGFPESRPAKRAAAKLRWLLEVGLGYLRLGQPINTLSGGESQRLKLASYLAECGQPAQGDEGADHSATHTLFLFDEPTTGLHFDDVRILLQVFHRLVDAGHSVLVVEHNLDVLKSADWLVDLGPEAGTEGGRLVIAGTPEKVAAHPGSHTGQALKAIGV